MGWLICLLKFVPLSLRICKLACICISNMVVFVSAQNKEKKKLHLKPEWIAHLISSNSLGETNIRKVCCFFLRFRSFAFFQKSQYFWHSNIRAHSILTIEINYIYTPMCMHNAKDINFPPQIQKKKYKTKSFYRNLFTIIRIQSSFHSQSVLTLFAIRYMHSFHDINPYSLPVVAATFVPWQCRVYFMCALCFLPVAK